MKCHQQAEYQPKHQHTLGMKLQPIYGGADVECFEGKVGRISMIGEAAENFFFGFQSRLVFVVIIPCAAINGSTTICMFPRWE